MKTLFLPLLVAALGQGSDDATARMKAMEEKIAKADSLQVTLESKVESGKGNFLAKGTLTMAGSKGHADFTMDFLGMEFKLHMVSDGTRMATKQDGKPQQVKDTPKNFRSGMTVLLARSGFGAMFGLVKVGPNNDEENWLEAIKMSDFKKVKMEKIGDRDTLVISYKLTIKDDKVTPTGMVWLDLKTNLPLKRVLQAEAKGENITVTETYSNFRINPKLDAKHFELPK